MDIADIADKDVERALQDALNNKRPSGPEYTGKCLFCDEQVEAPKRWCDAECRDQWERRQRGVNGKA